MLERWAKPRTLICGFIFSLWSAFVIFRYSFLFGSHDALWAGILNIIFSPKIWLAVSVIGIGWMYLRSFKKEPIRDNFWLVGGISVLAVISFWPFLQWLSGMKVSEIAPGIGAIFFGVLIFVSALALGLRLGRNLISASASLVRKTIIASGLGFGIFMGALLILGVIGLYYRSVVYIFLFLSLMFGASEARDFLREAVRRMNKEIAHPPTRRKIYLTLLIGGIFAIVFLAGIFLRFPVGYDSAISYLTYPKEYAEAHSLIHFPNWVYWGFPQNGEMLFTAGWLIAGFRGPIVLIFIFLILNLLAISELSGPIRERKFLALLLFTTLPVVAYQAVMDHKIEIIFSFYILAAYIFFGEYLKAGTRKDLILSAIFSGVAAGLKYFFLPWYALPILISFLWLGFKKGKWKDALLWGGIVILIFSPWLLKNLAISGEPLDPVNLPFFAEKNNLWAELGDEAKRYEINKMRDEAYLLWDDSENKDLGFFFSLPFRLTFMGDKKYFSGGLSFGPLLLLFAPLLLYYVIKKRKDIVRCEDAWLIYSFPLLIAMWIWIGNVVIWYALPIYALLSIWIAKSISGSNHIFKRIALVAIGGWTLLFISSELFFLGTFRPLFAAERHEDSLYVISQYINQNIPEGEVVWGVHEPRGFDIRSSAQRYIPDNYHLLLSWVLSNQTEAERRKFWSDRNIKYFLVRGSGYSPERSNLVAWAEAEKDSPLYAQMILDNHRRLVEFEREELELVQKEGNYFLYKLKDQDSSFSR